MFTTRYIKGLPEEGIIMWNIERFRHSQVHAVKDGKIVCGANTKSSCDHFTLWNDKLGTKDDDLITCGRCRRLLNLPAEG